MAAANHIIEEDQEKYLDEARNTVKAQAFYMKRCLDNVKLMDALKHASNMIGELRTSLLSPRNYNILYMDVCEQLRHLEMFLEEEQKNGKRLADLYEVVQYAGNILPRLYLVFTVGAIYIKSHEAPAKAIIHDMAELCRGVQHPTRGLFLRGYLLQVIGKDKLPDVGNEYDGEGGSVKDSIGFVLQNFSEMNKLWVRMQHQGAIRDRDRREKERRDLCLLTGTNLVRLANLEGINLELYKEVILPRLLDEIIMCKDFISQEYLMEVIIQVFPDELHIHTLGELLKACRSLHKKVDLKKIIVSFIDRLSNFASTRGSEIPEEINLFRIFSEHIHLLEEQLNLVDTLTLQTALLRLCLRCYPEETDYTDEVLAFVYSVLSNAPEAKSLSDSPPAIRLVTEILTRPLEEYPDIRTVLEKLQNYKQVLSMLPMEPRKSVSVAVAASVVRHAHMIEDPVTLNALIDLLLPLLEDSEELSAETQDEDDFLEDQTLVARVVPMIDTDDLDTVFGMFVMLKKAFGRGGPKRVVHTIIPLVFAALRLASRLAQAKGDEDGERKITLQKLYHFVHGLVTGLSNFHPHMALRLFLQAAQSAEQIKQYLTEEAAEKMDDVVYEFMTQVLVLYDEEIEVKSQRATISLITGALQGMCKMTEENYETLAQKVTQCSSKLLKKPDQSSAVCAASHLYWTNGDFKRGQDVLKCLQRSLRVADAWVDPAVQFELFTEILNHCVFYFEAGNESVTSAFVYTLVDLIISKRQDVDLDSSEEAANTDRLFKQTVSILKERQKGDDERAERYREIAINFEL